MIPKIIHYCWFGGQPYSPVIQRCIESWEKYCPDYKFKLWNEENSPMEIRWVNDAMLYKKYAFVADYVRFYALYTEGGIYLDTDMLLIKPIDDLLDNKMFIGRENAHFSSWGIIGMEKGNELCKTCMTFYETTLFNPQNLVDLAIPQVVTPILDKYNFVHKDETMKLNNGLVVYQSSYFYPVRYNDTFNIDDLFYPPYGGFVTPTNPTYGIHLWYKSWDDDLGFLSRGFYPEGFRLAWKRIRHSPFQSIKYYKKLIKYFLKMILSELTGKK